MRRSSLAAAVSAFLVCGGMAAVWAGDGVVALQTADPSCPDDTGNRYVDCGNGTVTDNDTGLVWLKNASCLARCSDSSLPCSVDDDCPGAETCVSIPVDWREATEFVEGLSDLPDTLADPSLVVNAFDCDLSDGSSPGEWRLPSVAEWEGMLAAPGLNCDPDITNDAGTGCWSSEPVQCFLEGTTCSFTRVQSGFYWSADTYFVDPAKAWGVSLEFSNFGFGTKTNNDDPFYPHYHVWPVRGGQ